MILNYQKSIFLPGNSEFVLTTLRNKAAGWLKRVTRIVTPVNVLESDYKLVEVPAKAKPIKFASDRAIKRHGAFLYHQYDK
jgi:hypothetical protein